MQSIVEERPAAQRARAARQATGGFLVSALARLAGGRKRATPSCLFSPTTKADAALAELRELMLVRIPFNRVLGIDIVALGPGTATLSIGFRPELIGDPDRPALHGGVISALADTAGGCAVWSGLDEDARVSTIDLRVDYLRPGRLEDLHAAAEVLRVGNRVGVANISLFHPSTPDAPVAEAKGVYSVRRKRARDES